MNKIKIDNYYKPESKTLRLDEIDYTIIPNSDIKPLLDKLQQENKILKETYKEVFNNYQSLKEKSETLTSLNIYQSDKIQQLKDNWNKLKEYIDIKLYNVEYLQKLCGCRIDDEIHMILDIIKKEMHELEQGSDSNVKD